MQWFQRGSEKAAACECSLAASVKLRLAACKRSNAATQQRLKAVKQVLEDEPENLTSQTGEKIDATLQTSGMEPRTGIDADSAFLIYFLFPEARQKNK